MRKPPILDERLRAACEMVPPCAICADIGADHGRLSAVLLAEGIAQAVLAADVSEKALSKAKRRLRELHMEERVTFAVADGLQALDALPEPRVDAICILGMGGDTIDSILRDGQTRLQGATLVLGPQTMQPLLRETLSLLSYRLTQERIARADGRMYLLMQAKPCEVPIRYTEEELLLGPCLLASRPPEWQPWLERKARLLSETVTAMQTANASKDAERLALAQKELEYTRNALQAP